ncbi:MAG: hypothetical protein ACXADB_15245 [Candidatus Hermodarchaeia archaeon]
MPNVRQTSRMIETAGQRILLTALRARDVRDSSCPQQEIQRHHCSGSGSTAIRGVG